MFLELGRMTTARVPACGHASCISELEPASSERSGTSAFLFSNGGDVVTAPRVSYKSVEGPGASVGRHASTRGECACSVLSAVARRASPGTPVAIDTAATCPIWHAAPRARVSCGACCRWGGSPCAVFGFQWDRARALRRDASSRRHYAVLLGPPLPALLQYDFKHPCDSLLRVPALNPCRRRADRDALAGSPTAAGPRPPADIRCSGVVRCTHACGRVLITGVLGLHPAIEFWVVIGVLAGLWRRLEGIRPSARLRNPLRSGPSAASCNGCCASRRPRSSTRSLRPSGPSYSLSVRRRARLSVVRFLRYLKLQGSLPSYVYVYICSVLCLSGCRTCIDPRTLLLLCCWTRADQCHICYRARQGQTRSLGHDLLGCRR
ncbi:hypothetical protein C8Q80DRAFT_421671 [Daedaleopsis nitida]|nr:hypothetical protein C8Q80DRAFT_421671 [Daedaleopsis nitida]